MTPITDPDVLQGYLTDASNVQGHADGLFRPSSTEEVADIVRWACKQEVGLTVVAGRTSTTAGAVPMGGMVLSMEKLDQVLHLDDDRCVVQGGMVLGQLQDFIESKGRFFPPDPTSRYDCTIGASIATNASGARSFRYGATRPWVQGLKVVLPTGDIIHARRGDPVPSQWPSVAWREPSVKTAAGYAPPKDLVDVFIGQEGTLGIITEATLRLTDLPKDVIGLLCWFRSRSDAVSFSRTLKQRVKDEPKGLVSPRCIEYLDEGCLVFAKARVDHVPDEAKAMLFCEQEVMADHDDHLEAWLEALGSAGALVDDTLAAMDGESRADLLALRHAVPAGINEIIVRNGMRKIGTDLSVPDEGLDQMMAAYEASPIDHVLFGHLGDNHLHLNLMPKTPEEADMAKDYYDQLAKLALELGGSVSAEHGIGKLKRKHLEWMVGDQVLESFKRLKHHLDPHNILCRGNII